LVRTLRTALALTAPTLVIAWLLRAPVFALHGFEALGNRRVSHEWLDQELAAVRGQNLLLLDLGEVRQRLLRHEWIKSVALRKQLPDQLAIVVEEHRPAALLRLGEQSFFVSEDGVLITRSELGIAEGEDPSWLRLLEQRAVEPTAPPRPGERPEGVAGALRAVAELERAAPEWAARLRGVEILGAEDYRLSIDELPFELLVTAGSTEAKVRWLALLLPEIESLLGPVARVDLRYRGRIVLRPSSESNAVERPGDLSSGEAEDDAADPTTDARTPATPAGAGPSVT
jgi:hypothetical protein